MNSLYAKKLTSMGKEIFLQRKKKIVSRPTSFVQGTNLAVSFSKPWTLTCVVPSTEKSHESWMKDQATSDLRRPSFFILKLWTIHTTVLFLVQVPPSFSTKYVLATVRRLVPSRQRLSDQGLHSRSGRQRMGNLRQLQGRPSRGQVPRQRHHWWPLPTLRLWYQARRREVHLPARRGRPIPVRQEGQRRRMLHRQDRPDDHHCRLRQRHCPWKVHHGRRRPCRLPHPTKLLNCHCPVGKIFLVPAFIFLTSLVASLLSSVNPHIHLNTHNRLPASPLVHECLIRRQFLIFVRWWLSNIDRKMSLRRVSLCVFASSVGLRGVDPDCFQGAWEQILRLYFELCQLEGLSFSNGLSRWVFGLAPCSLRVWVPWYVVFTVDVHAWVFKTNLIFTLSAVLFCSGWVRSTRRPELSENSEPDSTSKVQCTVFFLTAKFFSLQMRLFNNFFWWTSKWPPCLIILWQSDNFSLQEDCCSITDRTFYDDEVLWYVFPTPSFL